MLDYFPATAFLVALLGSACVSAASGDTTVKPWSELVDSLKSDQATSAREALIKQARTYVDLGIIKRVYKYEDVGKKHRSSLDGRAIPLEPEIQETFALAMSDSNACANAASELPALAAAYRLTGDDAFKNRIIAQLEEMITWSPLQRPGWTLYINGHRLPADGKDGNWLGTGWGIRAIADTTDILPDGTLGAGLRASLDKLLASEIDSIVEDWNVKRPWFVRSNNAVTNQWVLPTEGLVRACLMLGKEKHKEAYDLGVGNLLLALDSHGSAGEFEEGIGYANMTVASFLSAAHHMAVNGDRRAIDHPFLRNFPTWAVHHLQPGSTLINAFDCTLGGNGTGLLRPMLSLHFICTGSPVARWELDHVGPSSVTLPVAIASASTYGTKAEAPPLFAAYERAAMINWRDSWNNSASGLWLRGGHQLDQHDHQDRGHISYVYKGKPILIEDGTPVYSEPDIKRAQSCQGHNVLQIGDEPAKKNVAPIKVTRLDAQGGNVSVDASACYEQVKKWTRRVMWSAAEVEVHDEVLLREEHKDFVRFRWHIAGAQSVITCDDAGNYTLTWPDGVMTIEGSEPLDVTQQTEPQYTLGYDAKSAASSVRQHACILVSTRKQASGLSLTTRIKPR